MKIKIIIITTTTTIMGWAGLSQDLQKDEPV